MRSSTGYSQVVDSTEGKTEPCSPPPTDKHLSSAWSDAYDAYGHGPEPDRVDRAEHGPKLIDVISETCYFAAQAPQSCGGVGNFKPLPQP